MTFVEEEKGYAGDGCPNKGKKVEGMFQPKSYQAGVRCCSCDGKSCQTHLKCPEDDMSYYDAIAECHKKGLRLCTKEELLNGVCCDTGGSCNDHLTWTSTAQTSMCVHQRYYNM